MRSCPIFVADAGSVDGTPDIVAGFARYLKVKLIPGGLPSVGRNAGARLAESDYVLFLDADIELPDPGLVRRAVAAMRRRQLHCVTTNIWCSDGTIVDNALYLGSNVAQFCSPIVRPFATGMFMLFDRQRFWELGGFNEQALYAEDYLLSMGVTRRRFAVVSGGVLTSNRRFRKMGHLKVASLFLKTALNTWNREHFLRDHHYWET
jgi:glycosyltransferase involved in cell wall biosynthesis